MSDGNKKMMFEDSRSAPKGEQMDFVEVMELNGDKLIQYHKVYWGWRGFAVLKRDEYHRKAARAGKCCFPMMTSPSGIPWWTTQVRNRSENSDRTVALADNHRAWSLLVAWINSE